MIQINILTGSKKADYIITGTWAKKAAEEAKKFGQINIIASSEESMFTYIPYVTKEQFTKDANYVHITLNNTVYGTKYPYIPDTGDIPLVADISSCILSEELDVSKFGLLYAGAQKNLGPAGVTLVIIREDLIGHAPADIPVYLDYKIHAKEGSLYNTPPTFSIYIVGEVLKHIKNTGGIPAIEKINKEKAKKLYDYIDRSRL